MPDFLARMHDEYRECTDVIERTAQSAADENRDLSDDEMTAIERASTRRDEIAPTIQRFTSLRESTRDVAALRERAPVAPVVSLVREAPTPVVERDAPQDNDVPETPGAYAWEVFRASRGSVEASRRIARAAPHVTTSDVPGLIPTLITGPVVGELGAVRPILAAASTYPLPPAGMKVTRPIVATHTAVAKQTAEKTELAKGSFVVNGAEAPIETYGGYVNLSIQAMERSDPSALDAVFRDLVGVYAKETAKAISATLWTGITGSADLDGTDGAAYLAALYAASAAVHDATNGEMPNVIVAAPDVWGKLGALTVGGSLLFPPVNPQNAGGSLTPSAMGGSPLGLTLVVDVNAPAGSLAIGASRYFEVFENPTSPAALRALEVSLAGWQLGVVGMLAALVTNGDAWVKIAAETGPTFS